MKHIIPLFAIIAFLSSCIEEIVWRDRVLYDTLYIEQTVKGFSLDSVRTFSLKTVYRDSIITEYDTIFEQRIDTLIIEGETIIDTVEVVRIDTIEVINTIIETDTVFVYQVDTVEREATLTYDPSLENYVDSFFVFADQKIPEHNRLAVDIIMEVADIGIYVSSTEIVDGKYLIKINTDNCYEAGVYRELLHTYYAKPYAPYQFHPMIQNWEDCLEDHVNRNVLIDMMFIE